jgi:hypothetical protein
LLVADHAHEWKPSSPHVIEQWLNCSGGTAKPWCGHSDAA